MINSPIYVSIPNQLNKISDAYEIGRDIETDIPYEDGNTEFIDASILEYILNISKSQPKEISEISNEHAVITVIDKESFRTKFITDKFYLTTLQETRNEKFQIIETFGIPDITFFGNRVKTIQGAGQLLEANSSNPVFPDKYRWASGMVRFYEEQLRGSQLAKNNCVAQIHVGNFILTGYFLNLVMNSNSSDPNKKQFSFNFVVVDEKMYKNSELDVLFDFFAQLSGDNKSAYLALVNNLASIRKQYLDAIQKSAELSTNPSEKNANLTVSNQQLINQLKERKQFLEKELINFYRKNINKNLEG